MQKLICEITDLIAKIEQATIAQKADKRLMMTWGDLAEEAIDAIRINDGMKDTDQLMEITQQLIDIRLDYLKRVQ